MKQQTNYEVVRDLLAAKNKMEKSGEYATETMRKIKEKNPVNKVREVQLNLAMQNLKRTPGDARKTAARDLIRAVSVPPKKAAKSSYCTNCGAPIATDTAFCVKCGTKRLQP
jgi:RNA polymerase-binding transcription factor DksA